MIIQRIGRAGCYSLTVIGYILLSGVAYQVTKDLIKEVSHGAHAEPFLMIIMSILIIGSPLMFLSKEFRKDYFKSIDEIIENWFKNWWLPLTELIKTKQFWVTRIFLFGKSVDHIMMAALIMYFLPRITAGGLNEYKDWYEFVSTIILFAILLSSIKLFFHLLGGKSKKAISDAITMIVLIINCVVSNNLFSRNYTLTGDTKFVQRILIFFLVMVGVKILNNQLHKWFQKDLILEETKHFEVPLIKFQSYQDLFVLESVEVEYSDLKEKLPWQNVNFKVKIQLRYSFTETILYYSTANGIEEGEEFIDLKLDQKEK